jgi:hypothetical protein
MKKFTRYLSVLLIALTILFSSGALPTPTASAATASGAEFHIWGGFFHLLGGFLRFFNPNSACPEGTGYADGCTGAQASGSVQHKNFFTSYVPVNGNAPSVFETYSRPSWNVPGVDYAVGYSGVLADGTVQGNLPSCATKDTSGGVARIRITSTPCTLDHLDFSAGGSGACVWINSGLTGNVTFTNDKFLFPVDNGTGCASLGLLSWAGSSATTVLVEYSEFDNPNATQYPTLTSSITQSNAFIYIQSSGGAVTVEYSAFSHSPVASIEELSTPGTALTITSKYNYFEDNGGNGYGPNNAPIPHANYSVLEPNSTAQVSWTDDYDVIYDSPSSCCGSDVIGALNQVNNNNGTITSYTVDHSVLSVRPYGSGSQCAAGVPPTPSCLYGGAAVLVRTGNPAGAPMDAITLTNNWMDPTGAGSYVSSGNSIAAGVLAVSGGNPNTIICSGNKLLADGSAITGTLTTGFICN